ncbi:MAG: class I SAM-dependent methyltransferase [Piscinibacter sp.]|uniref:class I SAM-dependent methyltransferase n=1 Tax=Piscinibacter sp. TaxID=1903157 RepID=UPI0025884D8F|nr:class I SAM-dependent methyltransferase [Piscinibacter sp.]MCW5666927.1 class I SAM-dependent methyltransferase [Piscinibacter sp.]
MAELERAAARYRERDASAALTGFWSLRNPAVLHVAQERERVALQLLAAAGIDLAALRVLDVGCGFGLEFTSLLRWGVRGQALIGIDLMHERLRVARGISPALLVQASGTALPLRDASLDLVCQNVVFSSIVDPAARRASAAEMLRVLRPGGWLLWYDAFRTRARDPHFRAVPRAEVEALFPGLAWRWRTLTSDIGIAARLRRVPGALALLDASGLARTHLLGLGQRA